MRCEQRIAAGKRLKAFAGWGASGVVLDFLHERSFEQAFLLTLVDGEGASSNDLTILFPLDIAEEQGGAPDQYGFIEFEIGDETEKARFWPGMEKAKKMSLCSVRSILNQTGPSLRMRDLGAPKRTACGASRMPS
ncbi:hypothetical protein IV417_15080 [Alphaproteobacteria bacterium KMM 3653]|uniref:Uncharacterized protein n=1 Tax=Harenicola maris TaxID=2841044 RepID=A0AAP2CSH7_9RHOB|nr:hypothetical protein [Harenicola maris]